MTISVKYPRTYHVPWSPGTQSDDRFLYDLSHFVGQDVVVTEKMDGENTSLYHDHLHARAVETLAKHPSRTFIRSLHARVAKDIPEGWRVCGENIAAVHSIEYEKLPSFFMVFSIWNEKNECLSWDETVEWCSLLDLQHVPVLYRGLWDETTMMTLHEKLDLSKQEGYVVRRSEKFSYENFGVFCAKWVRPKHVQTDEHWLNKPVKFNDFSERD